MKVTRQTSRNKALVQRALKPEALCGTRQRGAHETKNRILPHQMAGFPIPSG